MKRISEKVGEYLSSVKKIEYLNKYILLESNGKKYIYLENEYNEELYGYLNKIQFLDYYERINSKEDSFSLYLVTEEKNSRVDLLSSLYKRSNGEVFLEEYFLKKIYEKCSYNINRLLNYYYGLQDMLEEMLYPRKEMHYLLVNISNFYHVLRLGEFFLNKWFNSKSDSYKEILMINNLNNQNFVGGKIVDFSLAKKDWCVFEIANYYRMYFDNDNILQDVYYLFDMAKESDNNKYLWYALISLVNAIDINDSRMMEEEVLYAKKTYTILLKKYEEDQKTENEMFNEKKENI